MDNPHQLVLDLLDSGQATWCKNAMHRPASEMGGNRPGYCALGLYRRACFGANSRRIEEAVVIGLEQKYGRRALVDLVHILHEQFGGSDDEATAWRVLTREALFPNQRPAFNSFDMKQYIITMNDSGGFTADDARVAIEKAAMKWEEQS